MVVVVTIQRFSSNSFLLVIICFRNGLIDFLVMLALFEFHPFFLNFDRR